MWFIVWFQQKCSVSDASFDHWVIANYFTSNESGNNIRGSIRSLCVFNTAYASAALWQNNTIVYKGTEYWVHIYGTECKYCYKNK